MLNTIWRIAYEAGEGYFTNRLSTSAAAMAFYTMFALGPIMIFVIAIAGIFLGHEKITNVSSGLPVAAGMGAAVVLRHDFEVLEARTPVPVLVFDAGVWEVDVPVFFVRQVLLLCPADDLIRVAIRSTVTVPLAAIALVEEPLVVPLHLVVEHDAPNASAVATNALLSALIGTVDVDVVGQLARLPETGVELLPLAAPVVVHRSVRFEQIKAAVGQDDGAIVGIEGRASNQPRLLEVPHALMRLPGVVSQRCQVTFANHPKRPDGRQHPRL